MIRNLIARYWRMPHDWRPGYRPLHRGRPALIAPADHAGATEDWSPEAELKAADAVMPPEPEETAAEAAEREAKEVARHWAELEKTAEQETAAELDALGPTLNPLFAAVDDAYLWAMTQLGFTAAEIEQMSARARALHETTSGMPVIEVAA